jgi:hypothetical protein
MRLLFEHTAIWNRDDLCAVLCFVFKILMSAIQYQIFVAMEDALTHWVLIDVSVTKVTSLIMVELVVLVCSIPVYT